MADSSSTFHSGLKHISNSFPSIPSLFVGFTPKGPTDSDSAWSPTSPLDFKLFSTFSNSLTLKSSRSSPSSSKTHKKWGDSSIGLGIVNSIAANETNPKPSSASHIIFGAQVKKSCFPFPIKSKSLPRNYTVLPQTGTTSPKSPKPQLGSSDVLIGSEVSRSRSLSLDTARTSSPTSHSNLQRSLGAKQSSLPISIGNSDATTDSLSASDIEDSEDYTCIISYGPNSKTTHIFGDRVLEWYTSNVSESGMEKQGSEMPQMIECEEKEVYSFGTNKPFCSSEQPNGQFLEPSHQDGILESGIPFA